jgi:hypothetical protein
LRPAQDIELCKAALMKEDASHGTVMYSILFFVIKQTFLQRQK